MKIESDRDFEQLRAQFAGWRKRFPMFTHDVKRIEKMINEHIQEHSKIMVLHRQTHSRSYLEKAQLEIDAINKIIDTVEKMELMAMLSRG
jgi:cystathionine beta-lyase family protein involved in aluminum resistance